MFGEHGSQWRRWDFHVHTPYSALNNQFGFTPTGEPDDGFDEYVKELFSRALDNDIVAIGITDYFSIDGYRRLQEEYLGGPRRIEQLFTPEKCSRIDEILVFPNVELRLDQAPVGDTVDYHVLFSSEASPVAIEQEFLHQIHCPCAGGQVPLTREGIEAIGRDYKQTNVDVSDDYLAGQKKAVVPLEEIRRALSESASLRGQFFTAVFDGTLSKLPWHQRAYILRREISRSADFYLSSNAKTRDWALGLGGEEAERIQEFGTLKPCIWGSDAHSYTGLFEAAEQRYCWVKGDPTFDGLRQVLAEPASRVWIGETSPAPDRPHKTIDSVCLDGVGFTGEPIPLSPELTCIIGGRSAGKSLLLRSAAAAVVPEDAAEAEQRVTIKPLALDASARVVWEDGVEGERSLVYIPQSYLNHLAEDSGIDVLISDALCRSEALAATIAKISEDARNQALEARRAIEQYWLLDGQMGEAKRRMLEIGSRETIRAALDDLCLRRDEALKSLKATDEQRAQYQQLREQESTARKTVDDLRSKCGCLNNIENPALTRPWASGGRDGRFDDSVVEALEAAVQKAEAAALTVWREEKEALRKQWEAELAKAEARRDEVRAQLEPLEPLIKESKELEGLERKVKEEEARLKEAESAEGEFASLAAEKDGARTEALDALGALESLYDDGCSRIQEQVEDLDLGFSLRCFSRVDALRLEPYLNDKLDRRFSRAFGQAQGLDLTNLASVDPRQLVGELWSGLEQGTLHPKGSHTVEDVVTGLFDDWFTVHYDVQNGADNLQCMSPGQKSLVLIEILMHTNDSGWPMLIDQPEDDLDNRSIYEQLIPLMRDCKKRFQIIVVTHNANIVVGGDAEQVIVANQSGDPASNGGSRFAYRCGSIENTKTREGGVLWGKTMHDHICDILEGGAEAFNKRAHRYGLDAAQ